MTVSKLESIQGSECAIDIRRTDILQLCPTSALVALAIAAEAVAVAVDMVIPPISMIDC